MQLYHTSEDCPGHWERVQLTGAALEWHCRSCGASYRDEVAVRFAVMRDYDLELVVSQLVREGRRLLGGSEGASPATDAIPREDEP
jgi:hypothetical protein